MEKNQLQEAGALISSLEEVLQHHQHMTRVRLGHASETRDQVAKGDEDPASRPECDDWQTVRDYNLTQAEFDGEQGRKHERFTEAIRMAILATKWARSAAKSFGKFKDASEGGMPLDPDNVRGFLDGLARRTIAHPHPHIPPIRPEMGINYVRGYEAGEDFARGYDVFNRS